MPGVGKVVARIAAARTRASPPHSGTASATDRAAVCAAGPMGVTSTTALAGSSSANALAAASSASAVASNGGPTNSCTSSTPHPPTAQAHALSPVMAVHPALRSTTAITASSDGLR